jgi:hypothetical protein
MGLPRRFQFSLKALIIASLSASALLLLEILVYQHAPRHLILYPLNGAVLSLLITGSSLYVQERASSKLAILVAMLAMCASIVVASLCILAALMIGIR